MTKLIKKGEFLSSMLLLATTRHHGTFDKGGKPYILHPLRVMHRLRTEDEFLQCIALGHDLVEDCGVTYQQLRDAGMPERVVEGIRCLTKVPGETEEEYRARVESNWDAVRVKMEDLRDNSDIRRLKGVEQKDVERLQRYHTFWLRLREVVQEGEHAHKLRYPPVYRNVLREPFDCSITYAGTAVSTAFVQPSSPEAQS